MLGAYESRVAEPPVIRNLPGAIEVQAPKGTWVVPSLVQALVAGSKVMTAPCSAEMARSLPSGSTAVWRVLLLVQLRRGDRHAWSRWPDAGSKISGASAKSYGVFIPLRVSIRPSGSCVTLGYQRACCMSGLRVHDPGVGVEGVDVLDAVPGPRRGRPSRRGCRWRRSPARRRRGRRRPGTSVKTLVVGFHSLARAVGSSQASHIKTSPVYIKVFGTATSGQLVSGPHSPTRRAGRCWRQ